MENAFGYHGLSQDCQPRLPGPALAVLDEIALAVLAGSDTKGLFKGAGEGDLVVEAMGDRNVGNGLVAVQRSLQGYATCPNGSGDGDNRSENNQAYR